MFVRLTFAFFGKNGLVVTSIIVGAENKGLFLKKQDISCAISTGVDFFFQEINNAVRSITFVPVGPVMIRSSVCCRK